MRPVVSACDIDRRPWMLAAVVIGPISVSPNRIIALGASSADEGCVVGPQGLVIGLELGDLVAQERVLVLEYADQRE